MEVLTAQQAREKSIDNIRNNEEFLEVMEEINKAAKIGDFYCVYMHEISYSNIIKLKSLGYKVEKVANNYNECSDIMTKIFW